MSMTGFGNCKTDARTRRAGKARLLVCALLFAGLFMALAPAARANCAVSGELQASYPAGSKHYVYSSHKYQYCDGTSWKDMPVRGTATSCTTEARWDWDTGQKKFTYSDRSEEHTS